MITVEETEKLIKDTALPDDARLVVYINDKEYEVDGIAYAYDVDNGEIMNERLRIVPRM
jgi:hypothetical protein